MAKIADFRQSAPYKAEYLEIMNLIGKEMTVVDAEEFTSKNGKGVHILIKMDGKEFRLCTHAVALVDLLTRAEVQETLKKGGYFFVKLVQTPSQTDKNRKVLRFEDVEAEEA